jgi:beta-2-glycoprotein 1
MKIIYVSVVFILFVALAQSSSSWQNGFRYPRYNQLSSNCGKRKRNLDTRRCFRRCTTDNDCHSSKRKCLCDGECGLSCVRVTQMCHKIGNFPNGHVTYSPDNFFGSKLIYSCNSGFTLIGDKVRTCEGDGWWSGQSPTCIKDIFCDTSPPLISNSIPNIQINMAKYKFGTEVEYQCDVGYAALGKIKKSTCQEDGKWSEIDLVCSSE